MKYANIVSSLPGPKAKKIIAQDKKFVSPSYTRGYPLVVGKGEDCVIEDVDGNRFLDMTAGIAVTSTGHCHPEVVAAIKAQAEKFIHMSGTDFYYEVESRLAEKLASLKDGNWKVFFCNSGAEAVESAMKLARYHTRRSRIIAFTGAFHGRTFGAMSLTSSKKAQRMHFGPLVPGITHAHYPNPYRPLLAQKKGQSQAEAHLEYITEIVLKKIAPAEEVAAIVVEPIQGEGGYIVPPKGFLEGLRKICDEHGIVLIFDEVQAGMGRTGKIFAHEHFGVTPDIITSAKGLASGMPLGAIIARDDVMDWKPGCHASTYGGNPLCCAASLATVELIKTKLAANAAKVGKHLTAGLKKLQKVSPVIGDVRGLGLMVGAEIVHDKRTKKPAPELVEKIIDRCFYKGLLLLSCGESTIRFCPPLTMTKAHVDEALTILAAAMKEACGRKCIVGTKHDYECGTVI